MRHLSGRRNPLERKAQSDQTKRAFPTALSFPALSAEKAPSPPPAASEDPEPNRRTALNIREKGVSSKTKISNILMIRFILSLPIADMTGYPLSILYCMQNNSKRLRALFTNYCIL